jgi:cardiolipin synthase A/B
MLYVDLHILVQALLILRVLLRPNREPASRIAWIAIIAAVPLAGIFGYLLLGETSIGSKRIALMREVDASLPDFNATPFSDRSVLEPKIPPRHRPLFTAGTSISGFAPVGGNRGELMRDSDATIEALVADIDAATDHVHLLFYIWLGDNNGTRVMEAVKRAAARGVTCRVLVDDLGSRALIRSPQWAAMGAAGVKQARALEIGHPILRAFVGRIDLRNHRKIVVIDNTITYCGSQNCADPAFLVKAKYAPWVDIMVRMEGPIARQNQHVFAVDWRVSSGEDISGLLGQAMETGPDGFAAQVVATGPTYRNSAMPEMFENLIYAAQHELVITTPYYAPAASLQAALRAAANRGVPTTLILPARNDAWAVGATARSYYADLLSAGVRICEYNGGLLHSKTLTMDGELALIGSANMDRRSFDLNFENNILLADKTLTGAIRRRQAEYVADSHEVITSEVLRWPWYQRLVNNTMVLFGPVL